MKYNSYTNDYVICMVFSDTPSRSKSHGSLIGNDTLLLSFTFSFSHCFFFHSEGKREKTRTTLETKEDPRTKEQTEAQTKED